MQESPIAFLVAEDDALLWLNIVDKLDDEDREIFETTSAQIDVLFAARTCLAGSTV